jgi:hypothetical protein
MSRQDTFKVATTTGRTHRKHAPPRSNVQLTGLRSTHILNVSSTLIGICLVIIASIHVFARSEQTIIDEITGMATLFFMTSCLLSFLSIRKPVRNSEKLENIADIVFLAGLSLLFITTILMSFNLIK